MQSQEFNALQEIQSIRNAQNRVFSPPWILNQIHSVTNVTPELPTVPPVVMNSLQLVKRNLLVSLVTLTIN